MKRCIMNKKSYDLTVDLSGSDTRYITPYRPINVTYKNINGPIINSDSDMLISPRTITLSATPGKGLLEIPSSNNFFSNVSKEIEISNYNKSETVSVALKKFTLTISLNGTSSNLRAGNIKISPIAWNSVYVNSQGYGVISFSNIPAGECTINIEGNENFESYTTNVTLYSNATIIANLTRIYSTFVINVTMNPDQTIYRSSSSGDIIRTEITYTTLTINYVDKDGISRSKQMSSGSTGITSSFTCLDGTTFSYSGSSSGTYTSDGNLYVGGNTNYVYVE